ncbi:uncharacterized protein TRAVEDRAFT_31245 [Trametes versicolor FP-101664 SS1]|uniref:uncharacterized protein n=1 Tax=Trametes versicolor (strain FP-101664) TaxID=717944 RepID=UPI00046232F0|nr:uncharacterized protein TRAVEDRAFT_31245 [Trametes versicolor FP-101664 SS1]EIW54081.1 hypothetical protein TRAVEDRAFT_31245 [Trametes versicolor FP-101664 SS1]
MSAKLGLSCNGRSAAVHDPARKGQTPPCFPSAGSTHFASSTISGVPSSDPCGQDLATICTRTLGAQKVASETDSRRGVVDILGHILYAEHALVTSPSMDGVVPRLFK